MSDAFRLGRFNLPAEFFDEGNEEAVSALYASCEIIHTLYNANRDRMFYAKAATFEVVPSDCEVPAYDVHIKRVDGRVAVEFVRGD